MIAQVNKSESFTATGLSLKIMDLTEFWVGAETMATSHGQWATLGTTSLESCDMVLDQIFAKTDAGKNLNFVQGFGACEAIGHFH